MDRQVDQKRQTDQHKSQPQGQSKIAFAGLKRDGRGQDAGRLIDIATLLYYPKDRLVAQMEEQAPAT